MGLHVDVMTCNWDPISTFHCKYNVFSQLCSISEMVLTEVMEVFTIFQKLRQEIFCDDTEHYSNILMPKGLQNICPLDFTLVFILASQ